MYDTIKILTRSEAEKQELLNKWLETQTYGISAKGVGEKGYTHHPDGTLTEACTLEAVEEGQGWGSATGSFVDNDGKIRRFTAEVNIRDDETSDSYTETEPNYPSAVFTVSGKLVHLAGVAT
ncbi:MAG TPA: hypothetical protein VMR34_00985 [Candidatus Saccharimonadales bacterium]|nr:hypothetical protein [Candidatus Saccharimonadales bacterium]